MPHTLLNIIDTSKEPNILNELYGNEPTKKSIYLEIEQTKQKSLNIEIKKPKQPRQRTTYQQDFNNINEEVYLHSILNPQ